MTAPDPAVPVGDRIVLTIVGSRHFAHPRALVWAEAIIHDWIETLNPAQILSGGAPGIDTLARDCAVAQGYVLPSDGLNTTEGVFYEHLPTVHQWAAPGGYRDRNDTLADQCTHLLAIRCQHADTAGSLYTYKRARKRIGDLAHLVVL